MQKVIFYRDPRTGGLFTEEMIDHYIMQHISCSVYNQIMSEVDKGDLVFISDMIDAGILLFSEIKFKRRKIYENFSIINKAIINRPIKDIFIRD